MSNKKPTYQELEQQIIKLKLENKLELSKERIQNILEQANENEYSIKETGRMAKIGYWKFDNITESLFWSDAIYQIYGSDPKLGVPTIEAILNVYTNDSRMLVLESIEALTNKGVSYDIELELTNFKNEKCWIRNIGKPIYNDYNEIVGRRGVSQDITEKKLTEIDLDKKNKKLNELNRALNEAQRLSNVGSWQWNMKTDQAEWSDEMYNIYGVTKEHFYPSNENVSKTVLPEDLHKVEKGISSFFFDKVFVPFEFRIKRPSGEIRHLYIVSLEINNKESVFGVTKDITEQKKTEEEKQRIQDNYKRLFDNATISIWNEDLSLVIKQIEKLKKLDIPDITIYLEEHPEVLFSLIEKIKVNKVNKATLKLFKAKSDKEFLSNISETFGKVTDKVFIKLMAAIWNNDKVFTSEVNYKTLKGDEFAAIVSIPIPQTKQEQKTVPVSIQSIQSIKNAELKNKESLKRINEAQKIAKVGSWMYDIATKETEWSKETYRIWGYDSEKPLPSWDIVEKRIHLKDQAFFTKASYSVFYEGKPYDIEFRICLPNNIQKTIRSICRPVFDENGYIIRLKGVDQDITEQKKIQEENKRIQDNYKRLFNNATISIWNQDFTLFLEEINELKKLNISDIDLFLTENPDVVFSLSKKVNVNKVNKATLKLFKAKSNEIFFNNIYETFGKGATKVFKNFIEAVWNTKKTFTSEVNFKTLEGDEFTAIISIPIPQSEIEQKTVPISIQSIQSIKDAELENKESLKKLNEAQKLAKIGSWYFVLSSEEVVCSEETFRIFGLDPTKGFPKIDEFMSIVHKDDQELLLKSISQDKPYNIEYRIYLPNGVEKWIRTICEPIIGNNGEVVRLKGSSQDITEQKKARVKIEKAEEMYRLLTDNSNDLISLHEPNSTFIYISPSIKNLLGYEQSEFLSKKAFNLIHPDDIKPLKDKIGNYEFNTSGSKAHAFRIYHKEGHYIWMEFLISPVFKDNKINYYVASTRDITQTKVAQQEIEEYQTSLQKMTAEMTLIEEKQKKEIASNIHDHLSQSLVISKMKINELKKNSQLKIISEDLKFIETNISEALENSRKITYELSPPVLYQLGIIDALNWLLENTETTHNITCKIISNVNNVNLDDVKSILLYRCIQEVVKNAVKYANATIFTLDIDKTTDGFSIIFKDNGAGFDTSLLNDYQNHSGSGFGLFAVQERIKNIQGKFSITSTINKGTSVNIFIPLSE